jgi:hypothetical protein
MNKHARKISHISINIMESKIAVAIVYEESIYRASHIPKMEIWGLNFE